MYRSLNRSRGLLIILLFVFHVHCLENYEGSIVPLDDENFESLVIEEESNWVIAFIQEHSPICREMAQNFAKVAENFFGLSEYGAVDCSSYPGLCARERITKLPTIKAYSWERKRNPHTNQWFKNPPFELEGTMNEEAITSFSEKLLTSKFIETVTSESSWNIFLQKSNLPKCLYMGDSNSIPSMFKGLSFHFKDQIDFAFSQASNKELLNLFKNYKLPALFFLQDGKTSLYQGEMKFSYIAKMLQKNVPRTCSEESSRSQTVHNEVVSNSMPPLENVQEEDGMRENETKEEGEKIVALDSKSFSKKILKSKSIWIIAFIRELESCKRQVNKWKDIRKSISKMVNVGEVDTSNNAENMQLAEKLGFSKTNEKLGCVFILRYNNGVKDTKFTVFAKSLEERKIIHFISEIIPSDHVKMLQGNQNFDELVNQNKTKKKILYFSNKNELSPVIKILAFNLQKKAIFAQVHRSDEELVKRFSVQDFPKLLVITYQPSVYSPKNTPQTSTYPGPIKYENVNEYLQRADEFVRVLKEGEVMKVPEVTSDIKFKKKCLQINKICILGFLENKKEIDIEIFQSVATKWVVTNQHAFLRFGLPKHSQFASVFGLSETDFPAVVAFFPSTLQFLRFSENKFLRSSLDRFLNQILSNEPLQFNKLQAIPRFKPVTEINLGKDFLQAESNASESTMEDSQVAEKVDDVKNVGGMLLDRKDEL